MKTRTHPRPRRAPKLIVGLVTAAMLSVATVPFVTHAEATGSPAAFTTVDESIDGAGHCANGNPTVNCNIYDGKQYVWMNGGPVVANLPAGTYFFAVLAPGGQHNPNDGSADLLSTDLYTDRTFTVANGSLTYSGPHDKDLPKIRLMPYNDTPNPGGVYIMAICALPNGTQPVNPSTCKYDAFKIKAATVTPPQPPGIIKDANGSYKDTFTWNITKDVDKTLVKQNGGTATFYYTVDVANDGGAISSVKVKGTITVIDPNVDASNNIVPVNITGVTDELSDGTTCTVTGGGAQQLTTFKTYFDYECDLNALPQGQLDNTATVSWPTQNTSLGQLVGGSQSYTFSNIAFARSTVDDCVDVTDTYKGDLGTVCVGDSNPPPFSYSRVVAVPPNHCQIYDNTATFTTNTTGTTGSASQEVKVCGVDTGGLTMGFWQNKNGQRIITSGSSTGGVCNSATWLRQYNPFKDLAATASCSQVASYVYNVIKVANAGGATMNAMLKAQMLATALDVYFSTPALGGNQIKAATPIGGLSTDLTQVSAPPGSATYIDARAAFNNVACQTVAQDLVYASAQSNSGGSAWYGQVKATQEKAKDVFDAINNSVIFAC